MKTARPLRRIPNPARERKYELARDEYLKKLEAVTLFSETDDTKEERIRKGAKDAFYFARTYLGHYFSTATQAEYHPDIVAACQIEETPVTITGPRGGAKSTIVSFLELLRDFCYQREDFIVLNMKSFDRAELYTLRILTELQHNPRIKEDFGLLVSMNAAAGNFATKRSLKRKRTTRLMAWGDGMSMRGLVSEYSRPTKIVCEDLQDREAAESEKRTRKLLDKIKADWLGACAASHWKFIVIGNVICKGSVIDLLQENEKAWTHFKFLAERTDAHGRRIATWPELFPIEKLDNLRTLLKDDVYEAEYLCEPREVDPTIRPEWIRQWDALPNELKLRRTFLILDPSISETGDNKALFAVNLWRRRITDSDYMTLTDTRGKLFEEGLYHLILRCWNRQATTDAMFEALYEWDTLYDRPVILYDGTFGQKKIILKLAARYALKYKRRLRLRHYLLNRAKDTRVGEIAPDFEAGMVILPIAAGEQAKDVEETIKQLTRYGKSGVKKDGPDAIAAAIERSNKVFSLP
jgi:hypothetical protein